MKYFTKEYLETSKDYLVYMTDYNNSIKEENLKKGVQIII